MSLANRSERLFEITPSKMTDEVFNSMTVSSKFLPRVQISNALSKSAVGNVVPPGHYALVTGKDKFTDLGKQFDCVPVNQRPKAVDFSGQVTVSTFDAESEMFAAIRDKADSQKGSKCNYGPEFLLWLPNQKRFATMFFLNWTMRKQVSEVKDRLGYPTTLSTEYIPSKEYTGWYGPLITDCSTPFDPPDMAELKVQVDNFLAATVEVEEAEEAETSSSRAR